jgi:hypothetical protein
MAWHYFIDAEGELWNEGATIDDPSVLNLFMKNLVRSPDGKFRVFCQGEECEIDAEDVPYVVKEVLFSPKKIELVFAGGEFKETLDPKTLFVGDKNVLYCKIRNGDFTARFSRRCYLELAKKVAFDPKKKNYFLTVDNHHYPIQGVR